MSYTKSLETLIWEIVVTIFITISFLGGTIILFFGYKFYKRREKLIIKKRYSKIVLIILALDLLLLLLSFPYGWIETLTSVREQTNGITWSITYPFGAYGIVTFNTLRYYMIYYDLNFLNSSKDLEWKKYINSSLSTLSKENWYISHRGNLGNERFMIIVVSILVFVAGSIAMVLRILGYQILDDDKYVYAAQFWDVLFYTFPLLLAFLIYFKTPSFSDSLFIQQEMKYNVIVLSSGLSIYAISIIIGALSNEIWAEMIYFLVPGGCAILCFFSLGFISTFWVLKKIKESCRDDDDDDHGDNYYHDDDLHSIHTSVDTSIYEPISLRLILLDPKLYNLFMQHLMKEFAMECLLSYTEFLQFKHEAHQKFNLEHFEENGVVSLSELVPKSAIVYDNYNADTIMNIKNDTSPSSPKKSLTIDINEQTKINMFKIKAYRLFKKYINVGAQFEINVSYGERYKLITLMNNQRIWMKEEMKITPKDLCNLFSPCQNEIYSLMTDSLARFKTTETFQKYVNSHKEYQYLIRNDED